MHGIVQNLIGLRTSATQIPHSGQNHFSHGVSSSMLHLIMRYFAECAVSASGTPYKTSRKVVPQVAQSGFSAVVRTLLCLLGID